MLRHTPLLVIGKGGGRGSQAKMVVDEMGACASVVAASPTCSVAEIFQSVINDGGIESYENVHVKRAGNYSIFFLAPT